ncbi:hypothetical protein N9N28_07220 [Rubripirellula amarantea]|uniref:Uncharacterized protein n=1 Tax=Rubripirellula amarantea TaxID=2527999 RepID=A0A5C5WJL2_9BACT|nr:hypothetical protein [Rubripirellula amarantea]MDA8744404.1 hypothetical protein [Rubripirellula amarantea]TWT50840.1 hypothetical protein Pla22_35830 [Rubripirellula amarantea]
MTRFVRSLIAVATLVAVLSTSGVASADRINNPILRRQHPNVGFWQHGTTHHVQAQARPFVSWLR